MRGFKVLIGGGLGAQPFPAQTAFEFLKAEEIIPFTESVLRVFDRYGERNNRSKARLKYLLNKIGLEELLRLANEERLASGIAVVPVEIPENIQPVPATETYTTFRVSNSTAYETWKQANVTEQKQKGWFAVHVQIRRGDIHSSVARQFATVAERYSQEELRITPGQSLLLRFVPKNALPALFHELKNIGLAAIGANAFGDITSCPGTDTCNLGISNSTGVATALENVIATEFPELLADRSLSVKISGCMNSCGQHGLAQIGFHGSSVKAGTQVAPALQLLLGGGATGSGNGRIAEKIIKFPSKRAPAVLRTLLADYKSNVLHGEDFNAYYDRVGKHYFYQLLKPLADISTLDAEAFIDWGQEVKFETAIGVGECAGVKVDLVATLLLEAEEAIAGAEELFYTGKPADSIYRAYNGFIHAAKALLLSVEIQVNTHHQLLSDFDRHFVDTGRFFFRGGFRETVLQLKKEAPSSAFAGKYLGEARAFVQLAKNYYAISHEKTTIHLN